MGGGGAGLYLFCFALVKMYNFLQVVVLLKNAVMWISFVQMESFGMKKKKKKKKNDEHTIPNI